MCRGAPNHAGRRIGTAHQTPLAFCADACAVWVMSLIAFEPHVVSVTEAAARGLPKLVREAEMGEDLVVERRGKAVAALISMQHLDEIRRLERDLQDSVLLLARLATDSGARTSLDGVIAHFGFDREELEAELDDDLATDR